MKILKSLNPYPILTPEALASPKDLNVNNPRLKPGEGGMSTPPNPEWGSIY